MSHPIPTSDLRTGDLRTGDFLASDFPAGGHGHVAVGLGETQRQRGLIDALFAAGAESDPLSMLHPAIDRSLAMTGIGLWQCDLATEQLRWSQGVWDLFAMERGEEPARGLTVAHYLPESRIELERLRAKAIASGGSFRMEAKIIDARGDLRWMRISALVDRTGPSARLHGVKQDITDERRGAAAR